MLNALALRGQLGATVRSAAAVFFPSLAVLDGDAPELGILLYLLETVASSGLLLFRTMTNLFVLRRAGTGRAHDRHVSQMRRARELMAMMLFIGVVFLPLLTMAMFAMRGGEWQPQLAVLIDRGRWLVATVLASAVLDTLVAPVRSPLWLQTAVAQQMSRLFLLLAAVMGGTILYRLSGSTAGMVAIFVASRLAMDVSGWRAASRRARRLRWFGRLADEEPGASGGAARETRSRISS